MRHARFGSLLGDLFDVVVAPVKTGAEAVGDVVRAVPGSAWAGEAFSNGADIIGDMAKDPKGKFLIYVITNAVVFPTLASQVGPTVASITWAIPDMAAGDSFTEAYTREVTHRLEAVTKIFGNEAVGKGIGDSFGDGLKKISNDPAFRDATRSLTEAGQRALGKTARQIAEEQHLTPEDLSARFGVRQDVAAAGIDLVARDPKAYDLNDFDLRTGERKSQAALERAIQRQLSIDGPRVEIDPQRRRNQIKTILLGERRLTEQVAAEQATASAAKPPLIPAREPGMVRVLQNPNRTGDQLKEIGTLLLLTAPFWGLALYHHRDAVLSALRRK